jgi:hypothetical protein
MREHAGKAAVGALIDVPGYTVWVTNRARAVELWQDYSGGPSSSSGSRN